jgi:hypothetical protein
MMISVLKLQHGDTANLWGYVLQVTGSVNLQTTGIAYRHFIFQYVYANQITLVMF